MNVSEKQKMDAFDDGFGGEGEVEVDPAAEFLAKEQEELGDIGEFPELLDQRSNLTFLGEDLGLHSPGGQPLEGGEPIQAFKEEEVYSTHSSIYSPSTFWS